jgi:hypothetical protein
MGFQLSKNDIECVVNAQPLAIERILKVLQVKTEKVLQNQDPRAKPGDSEITVSTGPQQMAPGRPIEKPIPQKGTVAPSMLPQKGPDAQNKRKMPQQMVQPGDPGLSPDNQGLNLPVPPVYYPNFNQRKE